MTIGAGGINLTRTSAIALGEIGNLVWEDLDADGVKDSTETGIGGVTLDLYLDKNGNGKVDPGDTLVGSTVTAADGSWPLAACRRTRRRQRPVRGRCDRRSRDTGRLVHSLGEAGLNNNSQTDPYAVTLTSAAPSNLTADFGYYVKPAALGQPRGSTALPARRTHPEDTGDPRG